MRIKDFITDETPTLKSVDTALDGLDMMDDFKLRHLPLLEGGKYLCLVSERDLLAMDDLDAPIGKPLLMAPSLRPEAYLHEAMALVARYDLTLLPVVGEEGKYVGAIRVERLLREVARWCGAEEEGGVVVLDIGPRDYALTERLAALQARLEYRNDRWYAECGLEAAGAQIFRRGYYEKELFAGSGSYGRSAVKTFTPYTAKVAAGYSVSARHYLSLGLMAAAVMPDADDMFLNVQYNNRMVDGPVLEKRYAAEAGYRFRSASADVSLTLFAAQTLDSRRTIRAYDDLSYLYCDVDVSGINIVRYGVEAAAEVRFTERLHGAFGLSAGRYRYGSNPLVSHYSDRDNAEVSMRSESYMNGCSVGGAPQLCATAELTYLDYRGWAFSCGAHAAAARYVDPSYVRRTERVARQASVSEEIYAEFMSQQRLNDAVTVDASASRWFYTRRGRIVVTLSVRNLLGTRDTVYGGYESSRIRRYTAGAQTVYRPLANIITYSYPRTYYCVVSWKF